MKVKKYKIFVESVNNIWYRGYTSKTKVLNYKWYSKEKSLADTYADMNSIIYGGDKIIDEDIIDLSKYNLLDLSDYDMNNRYNENDIESILEELNIEFDYTNLFDIIEEDIPLSRLINNILEEILVEYDGLLVYENNIKTLCINN